MDGLIDERSPLKLDGSTLKEIKGYLDKPTKGYEDKVLKQEAFRFHCGFMKPSEEHHFSDEREAFGAGGSFVIVEPKKNLTIGYTMNKMSPGIKDDERECSEEGSLWMSGLIEIGLLINNLAKLLLISSVSIGSI